MFRWYARFKYGVETIEDEARSGSPFSVRNEGLIAKVRERIQEERCATVRMMADEFGVNRETIGQILVEDLGKRKVASRFVPHSLSDDQRHERVQYAKDIINPLKPELNPICYLLALLGAHHFLHVSRIRVKSLTLRRLMSYIWSTHS